MLTSKRALVAGAFLALFSASCLSAAGDDCSDSATRKKIPEGKAAAADVAGSLATKPSCESTTLETRIEQLKELLQTQTEEIKSLRAELEEEQRHMRAMELEIHLANANASNAAQDSGGRPAAQPVTAANVEVVAPGEQSLAKRMEGLEGKPKSAGPFSFSGDFRLRDEPFFGGPASQQLVRHRERFRLRFNANTKFNDDINGGFSLSSGDVNDPISTNQTTNQFYARKAFNLDRAFMSYNPHQFRALTLTGGKFSYTWYNTELVWDKDLNPEGLSQTLGFDINNSVLKRIALVGFELPFTEVAGNSTTNKSIVESVVYGGQLQSIWQLGSRVKFSAYSAFYNYHNADPIASAITRASLKNPQTPGDGTLVLGNVSVQNSITVTEVSNVITVNGERIPTGVQTITNAQFASKFGLSDTIAQFDVDTGPERWPVRILGDFVQNTRACANVGNIQPAPKNTATLTFIQITNTPCNPRERRGYWLEGVLGRSSQRGDWQFSYTRMYIEREAVMGAFNYSELRQPSNVSQHRVQVFYQASPNIQFAFTGLVGRPLNFGSSKPPEDFLKRLQFDVIYKF